MFWGLIMEPGKKYSQTVEKSFHVSQAALDLSSGENDAVQVLLGFEGRNYLLCTLQKSKWPQVPLDLNFQVGDQVSFATNGTGHVHLTGYLVPEDDLDYLGEEEEDEQDELVDLASPVSKKRKAIDKEAEKPKKKSKTEILLDQINEDDTDDSDDEDVNLTDMFDEEVEEEEEEEEDDDEEDAEDDEDEEEEDEEETAPPVKKSPKNVAPKQNGIVKKDKMKKKAAETNKFDKSPTMNKQNAGSPQKRTVEGGVITEDLKTGEGPIAKIGKMVQVYYEGRLQSNNKMFDSSTKGPGFKFRLGRQEVIKGWDVGVAGMKVGGKRRITCPPKMAYGAQGSPPVIPSNSTLVFDVELKSVK